MSQQYGILFDCDGTVFDTEPLYANFWGEQGKKYHPEIPDFENCILGNSLNKILDTYFSYDKTIRSSILKKYEDFENNIKFKYFPGTKEFIQSLKDRGIPMSMVTSSNNDKLNKIYKAHPEFNEFFKCIITSNKVSKPKPDPEGYLKGAKSLNIDPKKCIVFEDSISGIKAAKAAGCFVVGLTTSKPKEEIEKYADIVVENLGKMSYDYLEKAVVPKLLK